MSMEQFPRIEIVHSNRIVACLNNSHVLSTERDFDHRKCAGEYCFAKSIVTDRSSWATGKIKMCDLLTVCNLRHDHLNRVFVVFSKYDSVVYDRDNPLTHYT